MKLRRNEMKLRRNWSVPPLELASSSLGTKKFQGGDCFWNSYIPRRQVDASEAIDAVCLGVVSDRAYLTSTLCAFPSIDTM